MNRAALAVTIAACSSHKATIQTREDPATVTTSCDQKEVTIQTGSGTTAIGQSVDARAGRADLSRRAGGPAGKHLSDEGSSLVAAFKTANAFEKVYDSYKRPLPDDAERMKVSTAGGSVASFQIGGEDSSEEISVQVSSDRPNETNVLITHTPRTGPSKPAGASAAA